MLTLCFINFQFTLLFVYVKIKNICLINLNGLNKSFKQCSNANVMSVKRVLFNLLNERSDRLVLHHCRQSMIEVIFRYSFMT